MTNAQIPLRWSRFGKVNSALGANNDILCGQIINLCFMRLCSTGSLMYSDVGVSALFDVGDPALYLPIAGMARRGLESHL